MAEDEGFEPPTPFSVTVFKTVALKPLCQSSLVLGVGVEPTHRPYERR